MRKAIVAALAVACVLVTGCAPSGCSREADKVSYNVSLRADNFNVHRRITVFNVRTDKVLWQMTGTFSVSRDGDDLDVICELPDGTYTKHFFDLNGWTTYVVEDLSGTDVSKYSYELNFLPETIPGVVITSND